MFEYLGTKRAIRKLKKIEPGKRWLENLRLNFIRPIRSGGNRELVPGFGFWRRKFTVAFAAIFVVFVLAGGAVSSAQAALPSDGLYLVKILAEKIQGVFIVGNEKKIDFALKLAEKRLAEADAESGESAEATGGASSDKETVIANAIFRAQNNLEEAAAIFDKLSLLKDENKENKNLEKLEKTYKQLERLAERKHKLREKFGKRLPLVASALDAIEVASVNVEQATNKIIITITTNSSSTATSTPNASTTLDAVLALFKDKAAKSIERAEKKIAEVELKIASSTSEDALEARKKLDEAKEKLADAKKEFSENDFKKAIEKANEAYKKAVEAEIRLIGASDGLKVNKGTLQIIRLLTDGSGKSGKVPPGLLKAPGIEKKLKKAGVDIDDFDGDDEDNDDEDNDVVSPVISQVAVSGITNSSATIAWTTNEEADSSVAYGTSTLYGSNVSSSAMVTSHSIAITGLESGTAYHFRVRSKDASGNTATSTDMTFTTLAVDVTPPTISSLTVINVSSTSATVSWTTNEPASGKIYYSLITPVDKASTSTISQTVFTLTASHAFDIASLSASSTYHFFVESADASGNIATSSQSSFLTLPGQ